MTDRELMQRALEALYNMVEDGDITDKQQAMATITALRERLAQPEQKPYAWMAVGGTIWRHKATEDDTPIYTHPPQRKPLTDEEISEIAINNPPMVHSFARAIEAAHGIKGEA